MELTQLQYFLEVAQSEHMTKSAQKLHIAQPSLTQAIHKLEEELGVLLFAKKGRGIMLTKYGKFLAERLRPICAELTRLPFELQTMAQQDSETIRINVLAASTLVTEAIIAYKQLHQNVHFQFRQTPNTELFDIEVRTQLPQQGAASIPKHLNDFVQREKIFLAVPNIPEFQSHDTVHLREVVNVGFVCLSGSRQFRLICDKLCHDIGFRPNIIFESDSPSAVINMVAANMGVGFYPEFSWGNISREHIRLLEIADMAFERDIIVSILPFKADNRILLDFFAFLKNYMFTHAHT